MLCLYFGLSVFDWAENYTQQKIGNTFEKVFIRTLK